MATTDETATYIGDLATSPPVPADNAGRFKGGAEIRKTKAIMKASFPNVTGAVTVTHTELNSISGQTDFIDDDTFATALSTTVSSSESIKAYIDAQFTPAEGVSAPLTTASGTTSDFTGIPAGVNKVSISFSKLSGDFAAGDNSSDFLIQLGDTGGFETSGYEGCGSIISGLAVETTQGTTGFRIKNQSGTQELTGLLTLVLHDPTSNVWVASGAFGDSGGTRTFITGGTKTLSGVLTQIRVTHVNGTDSFDGGTMNMLYEGSDEG